MLKHRRRIKATFTGNSRYFLPFYLSVCYAREPGYCSPKITSRLISPGTWLTALHCLLIDLTPGEHLQILGERRGGMYESGI